MRMHRFAGLASLLGGMLLYQHQRIVTMTKVYITSNNLPVEIIRHLIAHSKTRSAVRVVYRGPFMSEDRSFGLSTALFHVTMYRQYARKVGTSANSALIRYYLPRFKLSIALLSRKRGDERLVY